MNHGKGQSQPLRFRTLRRDMTNSLNVSQKSILRHILSIMYPHVFKAIRPLEKISETRIDFFLFQNKWFSGGLGFDMVKCTLIGNVQINVMKSRKLVNYMAKYLNKYNLPSMNCVGTYLNTGKIGQTCKKNI